MRVLRPTMLRAVVCTAADRPRRIIPNVYYGYQLIGVGIRLRGHDYLSIQWARPVDPYDLDTAWPTRVRLWAERRFARNPNATCDSCGYPGIRTRRGTWCPACYEDLNGERVAAHTDGSTT